MDEFLEAAIEEAKKSLAQGGIPIGPVLVKDSKIINLDNNECITMMQDFMEKNHDLWFEDIGK